MTIAITYLAILAATILAIGALATAIWILVGIFGGTKNYPCWFCKRWYVRSEEKKS